MVPLWQKHHAESNPYPDIELNPNLPLYEAMDKMGTLRIYTARHDGRLAGYQVFFVNSHPHSRQSVQAMQDILFLDAEYRRGFAGYRFIRWCVEALKKEQIECIFQHIRSDHDFGLMLERMGYKRVDVVYGLRVKKD